MMLNFVIEVCMFDTKLLGLNFVIEVCMFDTKLLGLEPYLIIMKL